MADRGAGTAPVSERDGEDNRVLVEPPSHVARVKRVVSTLAQRAPWLRAAMGPLYTRLSANYYRWVNRHERVDTAEAARRAQVAQEQLAHAQSAQEQAAQLQAQHDASAGPRRIMVSVPERVAAAKRAVAWVGARAPWLRRALGPMHRTMSRAFYHWVARHEWVDADSLPLPAAEFPPQLLDDAIARARAEASGRETWGGRADRTLHVIGTLGAGGSERQLVLLIEGIARRRIGRPTVVTNVAIEGASAHFAPRVSAVAELDRLRHSGDLASRV